MRLTRSALRDPACSPYGEVGPGGVEPMCAVATAAFITRAIDLQEASEDDAWDAAAGPSSCVRSDHWGFRRDGRFASTSTTSSRRSARSAIIASSEKEGRSEPHVDVVPRRARERHRPVDPQGDVREETDSKAGRPRVGPQRNPEVAPLGVPASAALLVATDSLRLRARPRDRAADIAPNSGKATERPLVRGIRRPRRPLKPRRVLLERQARKQLRVLRRFERAARVQAASGLVGDRLLVETPGHGDESRGGRRTA